MKVDGRKLRSDINQYVAETYPGRSPIFTVRSITRRRNYNDSHILEVRFDELDRDALEVWWDVAEWVSNVWWKINQGKVKIYKKGWANNSVRIDGVEVGYGFTHNG